MKKMNFEVSSAGLVLLLRVAAGLRRGPHHPRGHGHHAPHAHHAPVGGALTADAQLLQDVQHLEEDSPALTPERLAAMSPEELEFHYFSAHDFDRNSKLDGLELLKAVYHTAHHGSEDETEQALEDVHNDLDKYIEMVDRTLELDDSDGDGFVSYAEYRAARARVPAARTPRVLASAPADTP